MPFIQSHDDPFIRPALMLCCVTKYIEKLELAITIHSPVWTGLAIPTSRLQHVNPVDLEMGREPGSPVYTAVADNSVTETEPDCSNNIFGVQLL